MPPVVVPPRNSTSLPTHSASPETIALSMIDVITSCAPRATRRAPIVAPTAPPAAAATIRHSGIATIAGVPAGSAPPTTAHASTPAVTCAFRADVEQPGIEGDRDGEPGERERRSPCTAPDRARTGRPPCA